MRRCYAKELKKGPVFMMVKPLGMDMEVFLKGRGGIIGRKWADIGYFTKRKYALMLMKAIALASRRQEIKKSIEKILATPKGKRIMSPAFGKKIKALLAEKTK